MTILLSNSHTIAKAVTVRFDLLTHVARYTLRLVIIRFTKVTK